MRGITLAGGSPPATSVKSKIALIRQFNKTPLAERQTHIQANLARRVPTLAPLIGRDTDRPMLIVGGGPSVDGEIPVIRRLREAGAALITIDRMYPWCLRHGITPDYMVVMDADADTVEALAIPSTKTIHLVALQCHPSVLDHLVGFQTYLFDTEQGQINPAEYLEAYGYDTMTKVNGGGSVTLCAMSLALTLGCPVLHVFGFDCSVAAEDRRYAAGIAGAGAREPLFDIEIDGQWFRTTAAYLSFAQQFFLLMAMAHAHSCWQETIVYGGSLVGALGKVGRVEENRYRLTRADMPGRLERG